MHQRTRSALRKPRAAARLWRFRCAAATRRAAAALWASLLRLRWGFCCCLNASAAQRSPDRDCIRSLRPLHDAVTLAASLILLSIREVLGLPSQAVRLGISVTRVR
jgi:hypothetical protein